MKNNGSRSVLSYFQRGYKLKLDSLKELGLGNAKEIISLLSEFGYNELFCDMINDDEDGFEEEVRKLCQEKNIALRASDEIAVEEYAEAFCNTCNSFSGMDEKTVQSICSTKNSAKQKFILSDDSEGIRRPQFFFSKRMLSAISYPIVFSALYMWLENGTEKASCIKKARRYIDEKFFGGADVSVRLERLDHYYSIEELGGCHLGHIYVAMKEIADRDFDEVVKRRISLNAEIAMVTNEVFKLRGGARVSDEYINELIKRAKELKKPIFEFADADWNGDIREKIEIIEKICEELENYKTGMEISTFCEYNKFCYSVDIREALNGDIFRIISGIGIKNVELIIKDVSESDIYSISKKIGEFSVRIAILSVSSDEESSDYKKKKVSFEKIAEIAEKIGAEYIKVPSCNRCRMDEKNFIKCINSMREIAGKRGIKFLLSNKADTYTDTAETCYRLLLNDFENKIDYAFDATEFLNCGEDIKKAYDKLKGFTKVFYPSEVSALEKTADAYVLNNLFKSGKYADASALQYVMIPSGFRRLSDEKLLESISSEVSANEVFENELCLLGAMIEKEKRPSLKEHKIEVLNALLKNRKLPPMLGKDEMLEILLREQYGYIPDSPKETSWDIFPNFTGGYAGAKANVHRVNIKTSLEGGKEFAFNVYLAVPTGKGKFPFVIFPNFGAEIPNRFYPAEEIIDRGFAVLSFDFEEVTSDDDDMENGLSGILYSGKEKTATSPGKISMWAWAIHRVMDFACSQDYLDVECSAVCGHSRLGKTALLAAATDKRIKFAYSNNSGSCGAALSRGNKGETIQRIWKYLSFFFCENFKKHLADEYKMPFDQHYLAASIVPRFVYVASADKDPCADPLSEVLGCVAIGSEYEKCGKKGFIYDDKIPEAGCVFDEGSVGYHLRQGTHYLTDEDWNKFLNFVLKHREEAKKL